MKRNFYHTMLMAGGVINLLWTGRVYADALAPLQDDPQYVLASEENFRNDFPPIREDGMVNAVIEIMAGSQEKWEVKDDGKMHWDFKDGKPRIINYLGYPGNYGMIPGALMGKELGGDGDPLDIIVLGAQLEKGTVAPAKVIGVMYMIEKGEKDYKILAVLPDTSFEKVNNLKDLDHYYPGLTVILKIWFNNYKHNDEIDIKGFGEREEALEVLQQAIQSFDYARHSAAMHDK